MLNGLNFKIIRISSLVLLMICASGCGRKKLSERETRREQIRVNAEAKRFELKKVAGAYSGELTEAGGDSQAVTLNLEIKDVTYTEDGQIDPVLVPSLFGFLKFDNGGSLSIQKGDYDGKGSRLMLTVNNETYKDVILELSHKDGSLTGNWSAPALSSSGQISLTRGDALGSKGIKDEVSGDYSGYLLWDGEHKFQKSNLSLQATFQHPETMLVTGVMKAFFGEVISNEFLSYQYQHVDLNPVSRKITIRDDAADAYLIGELSEDGIAGEWFTKSRGKMGEFYFSRNSSASRPDPSWQIIGAYRGAYQGKLENLSDATEFPERVMVTLTVAEDRNQPMGVRIGGSMRLYVGPFGSEQYEDYPFSEASLNFFTQKLTVVTGGRHKFTIRADIKDEVLKGVLATDGLGDVATLEVKKL